MRQLIKRMFILLIVLSLFFTVSKTVIANSGPIFWEGYPAYEVLAVVENCPIEVESEKLFFDLSSNTSNSYTFEGSVTAAYEMINPTNKDLSVQMAFPFISSLDGFSTSDISITADGTALPYNVFIGDVVNNYGNPRQQEGKTSLVFADIVSTITDLPYQAKHFSENEKGRLYTLEVKPTTEQRINLAIDFEFDSEKTKVLTNGFNRYERDGQKVRIAAWCYEPEVLEIFVLGEDIDFNISAYVDGKLKENTNLYKCQTSLKERDIKSYLMDYVKQYENTIEEMREPSDFTVFDISERQLYNLYAAALDRLFTSCDGFGTCSDITEQNRYERILTLVYTVDFPANSKKNVSVGYKAMGTMDKTKTSKPIYSFDYILNPAKTWSSFKNLNIEIITPVEAPYIINSNIELTKEKDRYYTASLGSLPDSDFAFSVYADENVNVLDQVYSSLNNKAMYFILFAIIGILIIVIVARAVLIKHRKGM